MADVNVDKLVAKWLANNPQLEGLQGSFSPSVNGVPNNVSSATKITTSKGVLPFQIAMQDGDGNIVGGTLRLLINPSDVNFGSTQMQSSSYGRDSHIVTLWGPAQGTITGNGSSAAFFTAKGGLAGTTPINARKDTLAFANLMSFLAMIRHNGYYTVSPKAPSSTDPKQEQKGDTTAPVEEKEITSSGENPASSQRRVTPSHLNLLTGVDKNRVVHVMDNVLVTYDGTGYLGSFQAFTLESSAESPFKFNYSFEFIISGLKGDRITGHMHSDTNNNTGIRIGKQGTSFVYTLGIDKELLAKIEKVPGRGYSGATLGSVGGYIEGFIKEGKLRIKDSTVNYGGLRTEISSVIPNVYGAFQEAAEIAQAAGQDTSGWFPPVLTSALDSEHVQGSKHYEGLAIDIRINQVYPYYLREIIVRQIAQVTEGEIWVYWHPRGKDTEHIHMEYNPSLSRSYAGKAKGA
jgi:hypothetical protein